VITSYLPASFVKFPSLDNVPATEEKEMIGLEPITKGWKIVRISQIASSSFVVDALFPKNVLPSTAARVGVTVPEPSKLEVYLEPRDNVVVETQDKFVGMYGKQA